jgi:hypothetical protein
MKVVTVLLVGFEVLTVVVTNVANFLDIAPCSPFVYGLGIVAATIIYINLLVGTPITKAARCVLETDGCAKLRMNTMHRDRHLSNTYNICYRSLPCLILCKYFSISAKNRMNASCSKNEVL